MKSLLPMRLKLNSKIVARIVCGCVITGLALIGRAGLSQEPTAPPPSAPAPAAPVAAKPSEFKVKPVDKDKCDEKHKKDKKDAISGEKIDLNILENYYRDCIFVRMTQPAYDNINAARAELLEDIEKIEQKGKNNVKLIEDYNKMLVKQLREIIFKDKDKKAYHPASRIVATTILARLNQKVDSKSGAPTPETQGIKTLIPLISTSENDGMVSAALSFIPRHLKWTGQDEKQLEADKVRIVANVSSFLEAQKSFFGRTKESDDYLREQIIELLTIIASGKGESAKQAEPILSSLVFPSIINSKSTSEWMTEKSLDALGHYQPSPSEPADIKSLEKGTVQFIQSSLTTWNKRCSNTTTAAMGPKMGGREGGKPGLGSGAGGMTSEGGAPPSGGGPTGGAGKDAPRKNPYDEQPKEVVNARRILQQRLERIHCGIVGTGRKTSVAPSKGLIMLVDDDHKALLTEIVVKIEALQKALNDDKIADLAKLVNSTRRPIKELRDACSSIVDHKEEPIEEVEEAPSDAGADEEVSEDAGFGNQ